MKTAVVTGAGGFIGGRLTEQLLLNGYTVYGIDINDTLLGRFTKDCNFHPVCADIESSDILDFLPEKVDVVFHLALKGTMGRKDRMDAELQISNISASVHFCEKVVHICERFIFCSSTYEFLRAKEEKRIPACLYGAAKHAAADMCATISYNSGKKFNKVIFTNTFGVGDRSDKAVNILIRKMLKDETPALVEGNERNDWTYIDDTVNGLMAVLNRGDQFGTYYIGHKEITTFREKIIEMRDTLCPGMELQFGTMDEDSFVDYDLIDKDALYNDTGFECEADFKESIIKTANWLKAEDRKKILRGGVANLLSYTVELPFRFPEAVAA